MNENIDLTKILKDCPKGTKLYTPIWGEVTFRKILNGMIYAFSIETCNGNICLTKEGCYVNTDDAECIIFPSREQRDWSKFTAPWYKKERFDPKTLNPFDKVLVKDFTWENWNCQFFSHISNTKHPYAGICSIYKMCIPYNEDTKHLVGTSEEAPEYYRYWEI